MGCTTVNPPPRYTQFTSTIHTRTIYIHIKYIHTYTSNLSPQIISISQTLQTHITVTNITQTAHTTHIQLTHNTQITQILHYTHTHIHEKSWRIGSLFQTNADRAWLQQGLSTSFPTAGRRACPTCLLVHEDSYSSTVQTLLTKRRSCRHLFANSYPQIPLPR